MSYLTNREDECLIKDCAVAAYCVPTDAPEADGTLPWDSTTLVLVELKAGGKSGIGYTYADAATAYFINKTLRKVVTGADVIQIPAIWQKMVKALRENGYGTGQAYPEKKYMDEMQLKEDKGKKMQELLILGVAVAVAGTLLVKKILKQ